MWVDTDYFSRKTTIYSNCICALCASCRVNIGIYNYDEYANEFMEINSIANFYTVCYLIESLFVWTLECFHNLSCMLIIDSYSPWKQSSNFSSLDPTLNWPNETVEIILNQLESDENQIGLNDLDTKKAFDHSNIKLEICVKSSNAFAFNDQTQTEKF